MPLALVIADRGDARDAVGLFLAGRGWTAVPVDPDPAPVAAAVAAVEPLLVAVDFRDREREVLACLPALAGLGGRVHLFNVPAGLAAEVRAIVPAAVEVTDGEGLPRAPGVPGPPHPPA